MDDVVTLDFDDLGDKLLFTVETLGSEAKSAASEFIDDALFVTRHFLRETQSYQEEIIQEKVDRHLKFWNPNPSLPV